MRIQGYRITRERHEIDFEAEVKTVVEIDGNETWNFFEGPVHIFAEDELTVVTGETIKAGRRISECIGYSVRNDKFDHFLVKLT